MHAVFLAHSDVTTIDGRVCDYVIFDLDYPQLEQSFRISWHKGNTSLQHWTHGNTGHGQHIRVFPNGTWGSVWLGKRMQDSTWPRCAKALSVVSTKEKFSYVCMVGVNSHFKVLVFLCWAAWIRHSFMLRCIGYVFTAGSFCLCF